MKHSFESVTFVPAPLKEVFGFFSDAQNLEKITPKELRFRILTPLPIEMKPGALIDYSMRLNGVPMKWRTEITKFEPMVRFVDVQQRGPYKQWIHEHRFEESEGGTLMIDRVDYEVGMGFIGEIVHTLFVRRKVKQIFEHRAEFIKRQFASSRNGALRQARNVAV